MDPFLYSLSRGFIAAYSSSDIREYIYKNIEDKNIYKLLGLYNIKKILINSRIHPSFGFAEDISSFELSKLFSKTNDPV
jgi:hypothetical protein